MPRRLSSNDPKQHRARARRGTAKAKAAAEALYKPLDEWDEEELARGRPRTADGTWPRGPKPPWITPLIEAEIRKRFKSTMDGSAGVSALKAQRFLDSLLDNDQTIEDEKGNVRPVVPFAVRVDAAKYIMDRALGKPTTRVEADVTHDVTLFLAEAVTDDGETVVDVDYEEITEESVGSGD